MGLRELSSESSSWDNLLNSFILLIGYYLITDIVQRQASLCIHVETIATLLILHFMLLSLSPVV